MKEDIRYIAFFVDREEFKEKFKQFEYEEIEFPHVTVEYKPKNIPRELFGEKVTIIVEGYGIDDQNEGFLVRIESSNEKINRLIKSISVPHITLSVSRSGEPVNTRYLEFKPIQPFSIQGIFGGYSKKYNKVFYK